MSTADSSSQDLVGYLLAQYCEHREETGGQLTEAEKTAIAAFVQFAGEELKRLSPQSMVYTEAGLAIHLADGTDLALLPAMPTPGMQRGVDVMRGSTGGGSRNSTIQMGDYPAIGQKEPRHERLTKKP